MKAVKKCCGVLKLNKVKQVLKSSEDKSVAKILLKRIAGLLLKKTKFNQNCNIC